MTINGEPTARKQWENRYALRNRYLFTGKLVMQTALHIGGGKATLSSSDSPVVLTPDLKPFIPGSSFKGSLRSTVEKMVPSLPASADLSSCALIEADEDATTQPASNGKLCSTARQGEIAQARRRNPERSPILLREALEGLCNTCLLFGSPFAAARLNVDDLYLSSEEWGDIIQTRDGVAIDRDSEKAKDRLKYDFEVVPASATFNLRIVLENATLQDLQLISVGLSEFVHGFGVIGGKRSRGLGVSKLDDLQVSALELEGEDQARRYANLRHYLIDPNFFGEKSSGQEFLEKYIESIFG